MSVIKIYSFHTSEENLNEMRKTKTEEEIDDYYYELSKEYELNRLKFERFQRQTERERRQKEQKEKFKIVK